MRPGRQRKADCTYEPASAAGNLLRSGERSRKERLLAADMLTVHQAAALLGVDVSKILSWTSRCQCIAIVDGDGILKLPKWQFEPEIWLMIEEVLEGPGTTDAWELLCFLESPARGLGGLTPRVALERGLHDQVLSAAVAYAH